MTTGWVICFKNAVTGKMELIPSGMNVDHDDPTYEQEAHILPCTDLGSTPEEMHFTFGAHEFTRQCYCHPEVREQIHRRTLILHKATLN